MHETIFVLFGATGDLARLKILPALQQLSQSGKLDAGFKLIAVGRKPLSTVEYINYLAHAEPHPFADDLSALKLDYLTLDFEAENGFQPLWELLGNHQRGQTILYMSVAPDVLETCISRFQFAVNSQIWSTENTSILIEKPFGEDIQSAEELNQRLTKLFGEHIYRHDHYLGKDPVESIFQIRSQDQHVEQVLNGKHISQLKVVVTETVDIGTRAGYFEMRGMLVDWLQSHMLQILASICAELNSDNSEWHKAKAEFIASLSLDPDSILRAQYEGYRQMAGVAADSDTETFLAVRLSSSLPRWEHTHFMLVVGKAMAQKFVGADFQLTESDPEYGNKLMWSFDPPSGHPLLNKLSGDEFSQAIMEVMQHDQTNFVSMPEILAQWKITDEIKANFSNAKLSTYPKGTPYQHFCTDQWCAI